MPRSSKPRRRYRPGITALNVVQITMNRVGKLAKADVRGQILLARRALKEFSAGIDCLPHWRVLADAANMAETLAGMGIGSGEDAARVIFTAQAALAAVHERRQSRGSWTLYAAELDALGWLIQLHATQLAECDYGEFSIAFDRVKNRCSQALAGNAPRGAVVIVGDVA